MAGRHPRALKQRDERAHPVVQDALDRGYLDSGQDYVIPPLPNHATANRVRISVVRALEHFNLGKAARVVDQDGNPCWHDCADPDALHSVTFRLHSKKGARAHVLQSTGGDPSKLKYNPFARPQTPLIPDDGAIYNR